MGKEMVGNREVEEGEGRSGRGESVEKGEGGSSTWIFVQGSPSP